MPTRHNRLVNRAAVKSRIASEGYRTSKEFLDELDARIENMIRQGIRGIGGLGRKTINVEALDRGALRCDPNR